MAESLAAECTPLKLKYDSCFNSWFEGYLEPAVAASTPERRAAFAKRKKEEYDRKCGGIWKEYKECVQKAVKERGLDKLLDDARKENPLAEPPSPSQPPPKKT